MCCARIGAPFLNFFTVPSIERSPSGKSTSTLPCVEAECACPHRRNEIGIRIDRDQIREPREPLRQRRFEILDCADEEEILEDAETATSSRA